MARALRTPLEGRICHITDRCHNREFLLDNPAERDEYWCHFEKKLASSETSLLGFNITSNHVHLILISFERGQISRLMQRVQGEFAQAYNRRHERSGAFWNDRFHCTMVESGEHLWNCLRYVDLNMVRAGVARSPVEWPWCGYREICTGSGGLVDATLLCKLLGVDSPQILAEEYQRSIERDLAQGRLERQLMWTEAVAIGSKSFIEDVEKEKPERLRWTLEESDSIAGHWVLRDKDSPYGLT